MTKNTKASAKSNGKASSTKASAKASSTKAAKKPAAKKPVAVKPYVLHKSKAKIAADAAKASWRDAGWIIEAALMDGPTTAEALHAKTDVPVERILNHVAYRAQLKNPGCEIAGVSHATIQKRWADGETPLFPATAKIKLIKPMPRRSSPRSLVG